MTPAPDRLERAERILGELREATAEAAGVLKDMNAALAAARPVVQGLAREQITADVLPVLEQLRRDVVDACHAAQIEIRNEFNDTSAKLEAMLDDLVSSGNIYKLGMPAVEGVKAVDKLIEDVQKRNSR